MMSFDGPALDDDDSVFRSFRRWPLVPSRELLRLRSVLLRCGVMAGPGSARELSESATKLLALVNEELERRERAAALPGADPAVGSRMNKEGHPRMRG
jgi:hypothetical protein